MLGRIKSARGKEEAGLSSGGAKAQRGKFLMNGGRRKVQG